MRRIRFGFRGRQVVAMTAVAMFVALASSVSSATLMVGSSVDQIRANADLLGRILYRHASRVLRAQWPRELGPSLAADPGLRGLADSVVGYSPVVLYVAILDPGNRILFHSDEALEGGPAAAENSLDVFADRGPLFQLWALSTRSDVYAVDLPFRVEDDRPLATVRVAVSTVLLRDELATLIRRSMIWTAGSVLIAFAASFVVTGRILAPVERLRSQLAGIDVGDEPLDLRTTADAERVAAMFSAMARELDRRQPDVSDDDPVALDAGYGVAVLSGDGRARIRTGSAERLVPAPRGADDCVLEVGHPLRDLAAAARSKGVPIGPRRVEFRAEDGAVTCSACAWPVPGEVDDAVVITLQDSDRAERLYGELARSRKLGALGRIGSGVSHEVKNALNAVVMHAEVLRRTIDTDAPGANSIEVIDRELRRLDRVIETFLSFTTPETIRLGRVDLRAVVSAALDLSAARLEASGIRVDVEIPAASAEIRGDAELLRQAIVNLVTNACDAMPDGGRLRIEAGPDPDSRSTLLRVEDDGVGIPADRLSKIFDLFHTSKPNGSGIGLSTVYRVVHLHGGRIAVDSTPGRGTRFTILLPEP